MPTMTVDQYRSMYHRSITEPENFWAGQAEHFLAWYLQWDNVLTGDFEHHNVRWFEGAKLNACYNCLDRHLPERADQVAIYWEGDEPGQDAVITYQDLYEQVCRFSNVLKQYGIQRGDRVCIYLPMIPEAAIAMLACARIGAIHSVVFAGFSSEALKTRIIDAECKLLVTANTSMRGGKETPIKANADKAVNECECIEHVIDVQSGEFVEKMASASSECEPAVMNANDPLFILYTSGSTGKPKGILHSTAGYLLYATMSFQYVFDYQPGDIYWCTADVGWITGHSYIVYGPLASGATQVMFAGTPNYPDSSRFWQVVDKYQVNTFYTAPTAIRALMREGDQPVKAASRKSLRLLGTVGEPINPDVWQWYYEVVGNGQCPIVDTWWQTETGGIAITPLPGTTPLKPGAASWPFFGIKLGLISEGGQMIDGEGSGDLAITQPWPGQLLTVYGDQQRFIDTYFSQYPGVYYAGDAASCDANGYYWITGRTDDVINVSGHRLGTAEIESALVAHTKVAEAAVVDFPHEIKGQGIYAFVTPMANVKPNEALKQELIDWVRKQIGPIATPDVIHFADDLPKTRSGKIMRRILRKIVNHQSDQLGDVSTLANPQVVDKLIKAF